MGAYHPGSVKQYRGTYVTPLGEVYALHAIEFPDGTILLHKDYYDPTTGEVTDSVGHLVIDAGGLKPEQIEAVIGGEALKPALANDPRVIRIRQQIERYFGKYFGKNAGKGLGLLSKLKYLGYVIYIYNVGDNIKESLEGKQSWQETAAKSAGQIILAISSKGISFVFSKIAPEYVARGTVTSLTKSPFITRISAGLMYAFGVLELVKTTKEKAESYVSAMNRLDKLITKVNREYYKLLSLLRSAPDDEDKIIKQYLRYRIACQQYMNESPYLMKKVEQYKNVWLNDKEAMLFRGVRYTKQEMCEDYINTTKENISKITQNIKDLMATYPYITTIEKYFEDEYEKIQE